MLIQHSARVNGLTLLAITKLDVLSGLPSLKICTGYRINGRETDRFPSSAELFEGLEPIYEEHEGWSEDITGIRDYAALPPATRSYVERIAELAGVPIALVSVGYERNAHMMLCDPFQRG